MRLRENPFGYGDGRYNDIDSNTRIENKLIVGNVDDLLQLLANNRKLCNQIRQSDIDLLSGGPPCQGFSLAGRREQNDSKNLLPLSFAKIAGLILPKVVLLENVKGITAPFETSDGVKHYAWLEVAKSFSLKGFVPVCMLLNSKYFGVPQNRPRFILYAFRKDVFDALKMREGNTDLTNAILLNSKLFYNKVRSKRNNLNDIKIGDIALYDIESDPSYFDGKLLPKITNTADNFVPASEAIGDIVSTKHSYKLEDVKNNYPLHLMNRFKQNYGSVFDKIQNHLPRNHSFRVRARFRLHQVLNNMNGMRQDAMQVISGKLVEEKLVEKVYSEFKKEKLLVKFGGNEIFDVLRSFDQFKEYLKYIESKKHSQQAIRKDEPAPAQMTIPDDLCHYSIYELRTFTVREMARIQSFPDWFVFRFKITTGGDQRKYEIPQYTQVGNAVPPLLAFSLGRTIHKLLKSIE